MMTDTLLQNLRYTIRTFRRDAGLTAFVILIAGCRHWGQLHGVQRRQYLAVATAAVRRSRSSSCGLPTAIPADSPGKPHRWVT